MRDVRALDRFLLRIADEASAMQIEARRLLAFDQGSPAAAANMTTTLASVATRARTVNSLASLAVHELGKIWEAQ